MGEGQRSASLNRRKLPEGMARTQKQVFNLFEDKGYGFKLSLATGRAIYVFAPGANSTVGVDPATLNENGLRGHPGTFSEHIKFLRFADKKEDDGTSPLIYRYQDGNGQLLGRSLGVGSEFFSVNDNGKGGDGTYWRMLRKDQLCLR